MTSHTQEPLQPGGNPQANLTVAYRLAGLASVLLLVGVWIMFEDLATSNKPHELKGAPLVTLVMLANTLVCLRLYSMLRRALAAMEVLSAGSYLLLAFTLSASGLTLFILVGAASTVPAVLGW